MLDMLLAMTVSAVAPTFDAKPCSGLPPAAHARCGTVTVAEDRSNPSRRRIALNVIVVPAAKPARERQALFDLEGGPGLADTHNAAFYLSDGLGYSATRDVVLVDQRGTGESNPLDCPEFDAADHALEPMFPEAAVRSCRARLERGAALERYTTDDAVADLDAVREALGYRRIDLVALSYGTTLAMRYIALHGAHVRSAILLSAVPPSAMPPRHHATAAQAALEQLFADCNADAACRARYPALKGDLNEALRELRAAGRIDPQVAMERLRTKLHSATGMRALPSTIGRLATGDASILTSGNERAGFNYYDGVYLTITCSESLPWFDVHGAMDASRQTLFGDYRLARQRAACAQWPRASVRRNFFMPVRSSVPTLFVSGGRDPVTPARWAEQAARGFRHARHIVIPWAGHVIDGLEGLDTCFDPQMIRFLDAADPNAVDAGCFADMRPPAFELADKSPGSKGQ
jgi:pimeloyl-ACP methyl ester carboxylesterase